MSPDIFFGEGNVGPAVEDTILDENGARISIAGATVVARYRDKDQVGAEIDEPVDIMETTDPATFGDIKWTPAGPMPVGEFNHNWVVSFGGSAPVTFPNDRFLWMHVQPKP